MATRLPSGNYRSQVFIGIENGKRTYKSFTAETADAADLLALQYKARLPRSGSCSFSKAMDRFMESRSDTLSISTVRTYLSTIRTLRRKYPKFCSTDIMDIDRNALQRVINSLSAEHAPKTVRNFNAFICAVIESCDVTPPKCALPKKKRPNLNIPDEETMRKLFELSKGTDMEVPILLGALVPMRRGEIVAASIDDLSDDNVLHIHKSIAVGDKGVTKVKSPKTEASDRYVKLPDMVADKIREQGYICKYTIKSFSSCFSHLLEKLGIEHFRFHDLRHAFVSIAHAAGIPDAYIMARGGWATSNTVNNVYRHVLDADREKMENQVNDTLKELF